MRRISAKRRSAAATLDTPRPRDESPGGRQTLPDPLEHFGGFGMHRPVTDPATLLVSIGLVLALSVAGGVRNRLAPRDALAQKTGAVAAVPADFTRDPLYYFFDARQAEAVRYANVVLADPSTTPEVKRRVLVTLGTIRLAQRKPG